MTRRLVRLLLILTFVYIWFGVAWMTGGLQDWIYRWLG